MLMQVAYDLLVGADGVGSVVRSALQQVMPADYMRRYEHKQVYSMTQVAPTNPAEIPKHAVVQMHMLKVGMHRALSFGTHVFWMTCNHALILLCAGQIRSWAVHLVGFWFEFSRDGRKIVVP